MLPGYLIMVNFYSPSLVFGAVGLQTICHSLVCHYLFMTMNFQGHILHAR